MNLDAKLFFKINNLARRNKWLDLFGYIGSEWVLPAMAVMLVIAVFVLARFHVMNALEPLLFFAVFWFLGFVLDLFIALIVRRHRPHVTHPESKLLIKPIANWHSFPSDHAMTAFLILFFVIYVVLATPFAPLAWLVFLPLVFWVVFGRMFVGVHYPSDILGGIGMAVLVFWLFIKFLSSIT